MRTIVLANNRLGRQAVEWLSTRGDEIVGLVIHPRERAKHAEEIRRAAGLPDERVLDGSTLAEPAGLAALAELAPDIGLSVLFGYILSPACLALFPRGVVNLHPAYLPYNRGVFPNVWSIVERVPAGVSLHWIDEGVDAGDLVARREVPVEPIDTGRTLYEKLERAGLALLQETWPLIVEGRAGRQAQDHPRATTHRRRDVEYLDRIDLDRPCTARELIDLLRARTFPPYPGAYFEADGRRVYLRLELEYGEKVE